MPTEKEPDLPEEFSDRFAGRRDWRERLGESRDLGLGYAAPGGQFTRALYEACLARRAGNLPGSLKGQSVVELGAGMMPHGYLIAATFEAKNYLAIEPYYADVLLKTLRQAIEDQKHVVAEIPWKVSSDDMLSALQKIPDESVSVLACGIEDCILPDAGYKAAVEAEISRVLSETGVFASSHSDLHPKGLREETFEFQRIGSELKDRLRLHRKEEAHMRQQANPFGRKYDLDEG
jgi:hypothetical protein|tara:strand:+ start:851 stop:1552 length:702 start_codon:yes stop_codon:yes gene_type:complete